MNRFEWKPEYSVDDAEIDRQHAELIAIINELADQLHGEGPSDGARRVFDHLAHYVTTHFAYEEELIARAGYPDDRIAEHQAEHNTILRQVQEFERVFESGDPAALQALMPFLYGEWLIHHICGTDKEYVPWLVAAR
ncbi:bacteriohemerythrin [Aromatoleum evansii]|uniref:Bacteriohemerythrin n=1 Tax=Aromatoleum evansii TaxID=59406 RepID=A0ABZ1ANJ8_AROEV|nr:bacteriohemerythrin [Aromatoleum evansii]NMG31687.1 bacteriohemerythrin [Aromatoleum evansii]WRL46489.1 bacteriohemerythrin [Aromatoleum evansii]